MSNQQINKYDNEQTFINDSDWFDIDAFLGNDTYESRKVSFGTIKAQLGGGGGANIYNTNGTLTGNRTINGANNTLEFIDTELKAPSFENNGIKSKRFLFTMENMDFTSFDNASFQLSTNFGYTGDATKLIIIACRVYNNTGNNFSDGLSSLKLGINITGGGSLTFYKTGESEFNNNSYTDCKFDLLVEEIN